MPTYSGQMAEANRRLWIKITRIAVLTLLAIFGLIVFFSSWGTVKPGNRGLIVTFGRVGETIHKEGLVFKLPIVSKLEEVTVRQITKHTDAACFSSDLQQINVRVKLLYRTPEASVLHVFRDYAGDPFDTLIAPRVQEAIKEVTALETAEGIAKKRETIKTKALHASREKVGALLVLEDLVIENIDLSDDLERAIEQKMVQEQAANKAKFVKQQAEVDAETRVIAAKAEAESINIRGRAIRENPNVIDLQIAEKWNGVTPLVVGNGSGAGILLPLGEQTKR